LIDRAGHAKSLTAKRASKGTPKYADPKTGKTWSGFGRAPGWIAKAKNREAFLVDKSGVESPEAALKAPVAKKKSAPKKVAKPAAKKSVAVAKKVAMPTPVKKKPLIKEVAQKVVAKKAGKKRAAPDGSPADSTASAVGAPSAI
jgi:H-NS histone family